MGILFKAISGCLRRLLGGWLSDVSIIKERGVQWAIGVLLYGSAILIKSFWLGGYNTWLFDWINVWVFALLGSVAVLLSITSGHFPSFLAGTESLEYIQEQLANGRKIKFHKLINWLGEKRGFDEFGKEWCFWHLLVVKVTACILPAFFFGYQFIIVGALIAFAYPAMFWVQLKPFGKCLTSPTNFGEFITGWYVMGALL